MVSPNSGSLLSAYRTREPLYRAYWSFAAERQCIFLKRTAGAAGPWTDDPILRDYKFCNAYRASDRVSQFLISNVIYGEGASDDDLLLRIILFRLFSKIETWTALERSLGPLSLRILRGPDLARTLSALQAEGPIYTSAFILCANKAFGHDRKFLNHIELLRLMFRRRGLPQALARANSLAEVYGALLVYPLIGPFMAYQLAIDINYSTLIDFDESEFTVAGPGAERGIRKVFPDAKLRDMSAIILRMVESQEQAADDLGLVLPTLFGRRLQAIDCQNLFCELDKYARVAFPGLKSNRSRIKQSFAPSAEPLELFYPPKWGINTALSGSLRATA